MKMHDETMATLRAALSAESKSGITDLDERITGCRYEANENHKVDPNCYGAGYDAGYLAALKEFRDELGAPASPTGDAA